MTSTISDQPPGDLRRQRRKGVLISAGLLAGMVLGIYLLSIFVLRTGALQ